MNGGKVNKIFVVGVICIILSTIIVPAIGTYNAYNDLIPKTSNIIRISGGGNILYVGGSGPNNYTRIQDAIDDASNGDTIFVYSGTYYEHITIMKRVTLIGENKETTIIDGNGKLQDVIFIMATGVSISGFTIRNSGFAAPFAGIKIDYASHNTISDCIICDNHYGIFLDSSSNNIIYNNLITNNYFGLSLFHSSSNNTIYNNYFNNTNNAWNEGNNIWNISKTQGVNIIGGPYLGGNYWSDYLGFDNNEDGLGDTHLPHFGDFLPLTNRGPQPLAIYVDNDFNPSTPGWQYDHFDKIQHGIDAVVEGGIVYVYEGKYLESLLINKALDLIGEDKNTTIIDGDYGKDVVKINADWVNISNFTIMNSYDFYAGIKISHASHASISNCIITHNYYGVDIYVSNNNFICNNTIRYNWIGLQLSSSANNIICYNNITRQYENGLQLSSSNNNVINKNIVSYNGKLLMEGYGGIELSSSNNNTITNNIIAKNIGGIELSSSDNNTICYNNITVNEGYGVKIHFCSDTVIHYNNIYGNKGYGVYNEASSESYFSVTASYNYWGSSEGSSGVGSGNGDEVSENVVYKPWLTKPYKHTSITKADSNKGNEGIPGFEMVALIVALGAVLWVRKKKK